MGQSELILSKDPQDLRTALALIRTIDAEKRTHLAELRTGIGILTIPMSLLTILIATSNYYSIDSVLSFIAGLVIGIVALSVVGAYLVIRALQKIKANEGKAVIHHIFPRRTKISRESMVAGSRPCGERKSSFLDLRRIRPTVANNTRLYRRRCGKSSCGF